MLAEILNLKIQEGGVISFSFGKYLKKKPHNVVSVEDIFFTCIH